MGLVKLFIEHMYGYPLQAPITSDCIFILLSRVRDLICGSYAQKVPVVQFFCLIVFFICYISFTFSFPR